MWPSHAVLPTVLLVYFQWWGQKTGWNLCIGKKYQLFLWVQYLILAEIRQAAKYWGSRRFGAKGRRGKGRKNWWKQATWEDLEYRLDTEKSKTGIFFCVISAPLVINKTWKGKRAQPYRKIQKDQDWSIPQIFFSRSFKMSCKCKLKNFASV